MSKIMPCNQTAHGDWSRIVSVGFDLDQPWRTGLNNGDLLPAQALSAAETNLCLRRYDHLPIDAVLFVHSDVDIQLTLLYAVGRK
jgi:hypothetical protein